MAGRSVVTRMMNVQQLTGDKIYEGLNIVN